MTNLVSFSTAVVAYLRLRTLVNLVAFLPAPSAQLRLRAVRGKVTFLETKEFREIERNISKRK